MKEITLNHITKIEGHAKLQLKIEEGKVKTCKLSATEGARYFEGIVRGRKYTEAQEITSRICGICSCAHVVAAISAIESAIGYTPSKEIKDLRVLMTLAERIRSHATHLYFLALPDYLGYESALAMAKEYKPQLQTALRIMKVGNNLIKLLGGRDLHPVSAAVGGWLKKPTQEDIDEAKKSLQSIKKDSVATAELFIGLDYPEFSSEGEYFALYKEGEYAVLDGVFTNGKKSFEKHEYRDFVKEYHEDYSTANFVVAHDKRYFVGAIARMNLSGEWLSKDTKKLLKKSPLKLPSTNPYHQNIAQALEIVHSIDHALEVIDALELTEEKIIVPPPKAGRGVGALEVPRGTLWHEYTVDAQGTITDANIITPTAQNLLNIQEDIRALVPTILSKEKDVIVMDIEKLIRSHDPCFSCSAHFLEVNWE